LPRYVVTTRRHLANETEAAVASARDVVQGTPGVTVVTDSDPNTVIIDADASIAHQLTERIKDTHIVEPEIRRSLN